MQKLHILLIFILFSCSYPNRDTEVENQINHIVITSGDDNEIVTLDFNQLKPEDTWDSLIVYRPFSSVDADYDFSINSYMDIFHLKQNDMYVVIGFMQKNKLSSYGLINRNPDLLQILPPNILYVIFGRNDAVFNLMVDKGQ